MNFFLKGIGKELSIIAVLGIIGGVFKYAFFKFDIEINDLSFIFFFTLVGYIIYNVLFNINFIKEKSLKLYNSKFLLNIIHLLIIAILILVIANALFEYDSIKINLDGNFDISIDGSLDNTLDGGIDVYK